MTESRNCLFDGCSKAPVARRLCGTHYARWRRDPGAIDAPPVRPSWTGVACQIDGCESPVDAKGMCCQHYGAARRLPTKWCERCGLPAHTRSRYCSDDCRPACEVDGCELRATKRDWCANRYAQWLRVGRVWPLKQWGEPTPCLVCGGESDGGYRQFCSSACFVKWHRYDGAIPSEAACVACGLTFSLEGKRLNTRLCERCQRRSRNYGIRADELAVLSDSTCGICGQKVDMSLTYRDVDALMRASVDHVIPRSRGGTDDLTNLQLAHLLCNIRKGARVEGEPAPLPRPA